MGDNQDMSNDSEVIMLAEAFDHKQIYVGCHPNRYLSASSNNDDVVVHTVSSRRDATPVVVERVSPEEERRFGKQGLVSFRVLQSTDSNKTKATRYLSLPLYGDEVRQGATNALVSKVSLLLPEHVPLIIDFAFGRGTSESNFEGAGYDYSPLHQEACCCDESSKPNVMQIFQLTPEGGRYGIRSVFGRYWRSQHWNGSISQSPHCLADEKFSLHIIRASETTRKTASDW